MLVFNLPLDYAAFMYSSIWRSFFILVLSMVFSGALFAADDASTSLESFRKKIAAQETDQQRQQSGGISFSSQIKILQATIAREEYDQATSMLDNLGRYGLPSALQEEWPQIVDSLKKEIAVKQAGSLDKWRKEIESLIVDTRKTCLEAKGSADLDSLLVRCAALQMRRSSQNNVLAERTNRKLVGAASTISTWANFLDLRETGNGKRANEVLRSLISGQSDFPILKVEEIQAHLITDTAELLNTRVVAQFEF